MTGGAATPAELPGRRPRRRRGSSVDRLDALAARRADRRPTVAGSRLVVANVEGTLLAYRDALRRAAAARSHDGGARRRRARCPRCGRTYFLPARGPLDGRRPPPARAGAAAARAGTRQGGAGDVTGNGGDGPGAGRRRAARSPQASDRRRARPCAGCRDPARPAPAAAGGRRAGERCDLCGTTVPDDHRHLLAPRRAPDRVRRARAAGRCARATPSTGPTGQPHGVAATTSSCPTSSGRSFQIPIGLAFFMDSTATGCVVALYPSPGRRDRERAALRVVEPDGRAEPGARATSSPTSRALIVNRLSDPPAYAIAPIDRCYALTGHDQGALGGHLRRRRRCRRRSRPSSTSCRPRRSAHERPADRRRPAGRAAPAPPRPSPSSRCWARARCATPRRPMLDFDLQVLGAERARRST